MVVTQRELEALRRKTLQAIAMTKQNNIKQMKLELARLRNQVNRLRTTTRLRREIAETRFKRRKAKFHDIVGKFRSRGHTFSRAVQLAKKEYDRL